MIDEIVKLVLEEVWARDRVDLFGSLFSVLAEINEQAVKIIVDDMIQERRAEHDR